MITNKESIKKLLQISKIDWKSDDFVKLLKDVNIIFDYINVLLESDPINQKYNLYKKRRTLMFRLDVSKKLKEDFVIKNNIYFKRNLVRVLNAIDQGI